MKAGRRARHRRRLGSPFRRVWTGFTFASCGDGFAFGAVPLIAVAIDPRPLAVSAVAAADTLPWLLLALHAGHFADRYERGPVAALANVSRAAALVVGALLLATHRLGLWGLILVVLVNAGGRAIYYSSFQALVPTLVRSEQLEHANGLLSATETSAEHLAGPIAGSSLFAASPSLPFFADAVSMLSSCLPFMRFRSKADSPAQPSDSIWEGVRLLFSDTRLRVLVLMISALAFLQGMEGGVLVLLATTKWGVRESLYGVFLATGAVGNVVGSFIAEGQARRFGSARVMIAFAVVSGAGYLLMASAHGWMLASAAYALIGVAVIVISVIAISLRQRVTPDHLMGRVGGAWRGIIWGAAPVGALAAGGVATLWGLKTPLVIAGAMQIVVALVFARPLLRIIKDDRSRKTGVERHRNATQGKDIATAGRSRLDSA